VRRIRAKPLFSALGAISIFSTVAHALELKTPNVQAPHVSPPHVPSHTPQIKDNLDRDDFTFRTIQAHPTGGKSTSDSWLNHK